MTTDGTKDATEDATTLEKQISYPRQEALTRRFRLGQPRAFAIAPDGSRIAFVRSADGRDPRGSLWVLERVGDELVERCVVDALDVGDDARELPAEERARRERMRETTSGITSYSTDREVTRAAFSIDGLLMTVDLTDPAATPVSIDTPGSAIDPRLSPDGRVIAFVCDRSVHVSPADGTGAARLLAEASSETEAWGLADFVAAEELERSRGLWWLADSSAVLAERYDEAEVEIHWIGDPAEPTREPTPHRYPRAGTANPHATLFVLPLHGEAVEVAWDHEAFPYLATVVTSTDGPGAVVSLLSRDQSNQLIVDVAADGSVRERATRTTSPWITMQPGVPHVDREGRLLEIVADPETDTFRLVRDHEPLTPAGLQVTGVVTQSADGIVLTAQDNPLDQGVYHLSEDGTLTALAVDPGIHSAFANSRGRVTISHRPDALGTSIAVDLDGLMGSIASQAEHPVVHPQPQWHRVTDRQLACAVLLPTGHVAGSRQLPVVMAPYGGPHHARVVHAAGAYASDQWLADQGFAVIVVDGAGTPGRGPSFEFEVHHDLATQVLQDQVDALHALAQIHPDLDLARVGITGWSFGGYLAALAVLDRPDVFHAAVAGAPVTDWRLYDTAYTERYLGTPQEEPQAYELTSLLRRAPQLQRPLLIVHGLADDNVLAAHTLQFSSALLAAGRPHSVLPLSGVTHMTPQEIVAENLLRLEVDFLQRHLQ
ncbi:MAG: prolyl oligopeptidase family serine peptidase [Actinomycetota bacterium]|nr:prolyl oligopeptidase family serine peptidase [Actinomycetota bacterium]